MLKGYQEPPPPPPEPPPDDPPPDEPPEDLGEDDMAVVAEDMVLFINVPNVAMENALVPTYQLGDCIVIVSNFLIHLSEIPNT